MLLELHIIAYEVDEPFQSKCDVTKVVTYSKRSVVHSRPLHFDMLDISEIRRIHMMYIRVSPTLPAAFKAIVET